MYGLNEEGGYGGRLGRQAGDISPPVRITMVDEVLIDPTTGESVAVLVMDQPWRIVASSLVSPTCQAAAISEALKLAFR